MKVLPHNGGLEELDCLETAVTRLAVVLRLAIANGPDAGREAIFVKAVGADRVVRQLLEVDTQGVEFRADLIVASEESLVLGPEQLPMLFVVLVHVADNLNVFLGAMDQYLVIFVWH